MRAPTDNEIRRFFAERPAIALNRIDQELGLIRNKMSKFLREEPGQYLPEEAKEKLGKIMKLYGWRKDAFRTGLRERVDKLEQAVEK